VVRRGRDPFISSHARHIDLVIADAVARTNPPNVLSRVLSKVDILRRDSISRRRGTLPRMLDLVAGLPNISRLTLNLHVDEDSPIEPTLAIVWPTLAPRLLSLHIHVHGMASCAPFLNLDGGHLIQLVNMRITYDQIPTNPVRPRQASLAPHTPPNVVEDIAHRMAKLASGAQRTLKSLRMDFMLDWYLGPEVFLREISRHHFVELNSLHLRLPGFYGESPEMSTFVRRHARTLTSYRAAFDDLLKNRYMLPNDSLCPLVQDMRTLTRVQTLEIQLCGFLCLWAGPGPEGFTFGALLMVLGAMPDSVRALELCSNGEISYLSSTEVARVAHQPALATLSSFRGTALGNLRSLIIGVHLPEETSYLFHALELGLPLLEDLRLHVSSLIPKKRYVRKKQVCGGLTHAYIKSTG
jgi:hypothetical protein